MEKGKINKTFYVDEDIADFIDSTAIRLTKTAHGRSALTNEAFKFVRANIVSFEAWWDNRGDNENG